MRRRDGNSRFLYSPFLSYFSTICYGVSSESCLRPPMQRIKRSAYEVFKVYSLVESVLFHAPTVLQDCYRYRNESKRIRTFTYSESQQVKHEFQLLLFTINIATSFSLSCFPIANNAIQILVKYSSCHKIRNFRVLHKPVLEARLSALFHMFLQSIEFTTSFVCCWHVIKIFC